MRSDENCASVLFNTPTATRWCPKVNERGAADMVASNVQQARWQRCHDGKPVLGASCLPAG